jgi:hypothetical protein
MRIILRGVGRKWYNANRKEMDDFSGDEGFFLFVSLAVSLAACIAYYRPLLGIDRPTSRQLWCQVFLSILPMCCPFLTYLILANWADPQVRDNGGYVFLFIVGGIAWFFIAAQWVRLLGLSFRDDAIERNNLAAAVAVAAAVLSASIIYALANVGSGPTIWTTILPAAGGTLLFVLLWLCTLAAGGTIVDSIAIDRDLATGIRLGGAFIGSALILGRAAGGNFIDWDQTWIDLLAYGWPAFVLCAAAATVHRRFAPTPDCLHRAPFKFGLVPATIFIAGGILFVLCTPHGWRPLQW